MSLNSLEQAAAAINAGIEADYFDLLQQSSAIRDHIDDQLKDWRVSALAKIQAEFPFHDHAKKLSDWTPHLGSPDLSRPDLEQAVSDFTSFCYSAKHPANQSFWQRLVSFEETDGRRSAQSRENVSLSGQLLLSEWQKLMDQARSEWELKTIEMLRNELMRSLESLLNQLELLRRQIESLGLDPGLLLDLSKGNLSAQDIEQFQRWASYLEKDAGVRSLCELLGKVRAIELSEKIERVLVDQTYQVQMPDINSREEIVGIRLGRDLEHALPSEKALLADEDTAILFDLKFVESGLMCFDMQGTQMVNETIAVEQDRQVTEQEKQGPMVICVDTSGSMSGAPETIAKAVALFISTKAREQKRPCYLINFSTGIQTLELSDNMGMASLVDFLKMSFWGGTDAAPALAHTLEVMERDDYKKADLLIISDFLMFGLPEELLEAIETQRKQGNRFYSLVVGSSYMSNRLETLFDQEWVYDPATSRIQELVSFQSVMLQDRLERAAIDSQL